MYENKNIEPSSPEDSLESGRNRMPNGSNFSIRDQGEIVKNASADAVGKKLSDHDDTTSGKMLKVGGIGSHI